MTADLAPPDGNKGSRSAVGAPPCQDVAVGGLHYGKHMSGALVGHAGCWIGTVLGVSVWIRCFRFWFTYLIW